MIKTARQLKDLIRNLSREKSADAQILMRNYMMERFLERISLSEYRDKFILKGGMLVAAMVGLDARSTMDLDATIKGANVNVEDIENLADSLSAAQDETKAVLSDVMRLPERFRVPIVLYYYLGFSTSEIAELMHVPAATVRTRLARGRSMLKFIIEEGAREIQSNQAGLRVHPSR